MAQQLPQPGKDHDKVGRARGGAAPTPGRITPARGPRGPLTSTHWPLSTADCP
jgi:hypothetical protein